MADSGARPVRVEKKNGILTVYLDNPPENRLNGDMLQELQGSCDLMTGDDVEIVVFTGAGRAFSMGADLQYLKSLHTSEHIANLVATANDIFDFIENLDKITIAAINGACFGGALELALACHFRLCVDKTRLGLTEVMNGLVPAAGGIPRLMALVGRSRALELVFLGSMISSQQALEIGLVHRVLAPQSFAEQVDGFIRTLLLNGTAVNRTLVRLCREARCERSPSRRQSLAAHCVDLFLGNEYNSRRAGE